LICNCYSATFARANYGTRIIAIILMTVICPYFVLVVVFYVIAIRTRCYWQSKY